MQQKKTHELAAEAFRLLDEMAESGGVYPSSVKLDQYTHILDALSRDLSVDVYNSVLEIMVKLYYLRGSGKCLFVNLLLDQTYHTLKKSTGMKVSDIRFF